MDNNLTYRLSLKDFFRKTMLGAVEDTKKLDAGMGKLNRTVNRVGGAIAGYFAIGAIQNFGNQILQSTANMQAFENSIRAASGSDIAGNSNIAFLNSQVDRLGISLSAAQAGYKTFTGSVMGTNIQGDKANKIFRQVSEASTVLGLSAEQTEGSFLALGQMISKGTVQAEELRGQLAERIPGAFQIGARAMGVSTEKLGEMMKEGLVKADDFLVKFGNELEKQFGGKLDEATHSLRSNLNRWDTEWERLRVNMGNSQTGMITGTINWAQNILKNFNNVLAGLNRMDEAFIRSGKNLEYGLLEKFNNTLFMGSTSDFANMFTGGKGKMDMFERSLQDMYVKPGQRNDLEALRSKEQLTKLKMGHNKAFINKEIDKLEYDRKIALIDHALSQIATGAEKKLAGKGIAEAATNGGKAAGSTIGSATEVYGAAPKNINIKVDRVGPENLVIQSQTMEAGIQEAAYMTKKEFLEMLNDANNVG